MAEGTLVVTQSKTVVVKYVTAKGKEATGQIPAGELSADLVRLRDDKRTIDQLNGVPVEFELQGAVLKRIRRKGQPFEVAQAPPVRQAGPQRGQQGPGTRHGHREAATRSQPSPRRQEGPPDGSAFHNPYNFVPALPREQVTGELGDHPPVGHHVLYPDRYTGVIRVRMTAVTPLLVPDAANAVDVGNDHRSFPLRVDADGKPYIPPTSIKGMLRAAYEAVTNSRLAVFPGHEDRLADRMPAQQGLALVPARVIDEQTIELLPGTSKIQPDGRPSGPMYAAWLPRYDVRTGKEDQSRSPAYPDGRLPQHGDHVTCWITETRHRSGRFSFHRVIKIFPHGSATGSPPQGAIQVDGYVCITHRNIDRKHDERVFFTTNKEPILRPLTEALHRQWRELISNYQMIHEDEIRRKMKGPPALINSEWSRHIVGESKERQLSPGTLCYAALQKNQISALYPVMISRRLFACSPRSLLPKSLHPATSRAQLSPADRVFGWVNPQGPGAYKGNLRIGPVACQTPPEAAIAWFHSQQRNLAEDTRAEPGLPLAILGQPKPQQARFYVAKSPKGEAQEDGISKEDAGYKENKGLRGRKVYPHPRGLPPGHWDNPLQDRTQQAVNGHFQEYRRPKLNGKEQRDNQNRSIQGWVKPGTVFTFDVYVTNLSPVELGALLWLLSLPEGHFHRFGGGKPLGLGSVRLQIDPAHTRLHHGDAWKEAYLTLEDSQPAEAEQGALIRAFQEAVQAAYGSPHGPFEQVPFIAAFLRMAAGHPDNLPTHYPRARPRGAGTAPLPGPVPPHPEGKAYEWFVANERTGQNEGPKRSLPDLARDRGLPML